MEEDDVTHLWPSITIRSLSLRLRDVCRALSSLMMLLLEDVSWVFSSRWFFNAVMLSEPVVVVPCWRLPARKDAVDNGMQDLDRSNALRKCMIFVRSFKLNLGEAAKMG
jgi:hypothetical protein